MVIGSGAGAMGTEAVPRPVARLTLSTIMPR
jgi:hypothetical protein